VNKKAIVLSVKETMDALSKKGPFREEMFVDESGTIRVLRAITSDSPSDEAEIHGNWHDIFFVLEGEEEFFIGEDINDKQLVGSPEDGEWTGKELVGAEKHLIKKGNMIIIPKGVPHKHGKGKIRLIIIKAK